MTNETKKIEILVVEDKEEHLKDAKELFNEFGSIININTDFVKSYSETQKKLTAKTYDGILSDVFLPTESEEHFSKLKPIMGDVETSIHFEPKDTQKFEKKCYGNKTNYLFDFKEIGKNDSKRLFGDELPYGIMIAKYALKNELPIVLITDTYHHGEKTEPICMWARGKSIPLIDREEDKGYSFSGKDWLAGFGTLIWMLDGKKKGLVKINPKGIDTRLSLGGGFRYLLKEIIEEGKINPKYHVGQEESIKSFKNMFKEYKFNCFLTKDSIKKYL